MSKLDDFKKNVVADGRSYSDELFEKAVKILKSDRKGIAVDEEHQVRFEALAAELKTMSSA